MAVTKDVVLLYSLGLLDAERRQAVEEAAEHDVVVRYWIRHLDPNAIDPPEPLVKLARELTEELRAERAADKSATEEDL